MSDISNRAEMFGGDKVLRGIVGIVSPLEVPQSFKAVELEFWDRSMSMPLNNCNKISFVLS